MVTIIQLLTPLYCGGARCEHTWLIDIPLFAAAAAIESNMREQHNHRALLQYICGLLMTWSDSGVCALLSLIACACVCL